MRRNYSEPVLEVRKYSIHADIFTDSDPGLHEGDEYDLDAIDEGGEPTADLFADEPE